MSLQDFESQYNNVHLFVFAQCPSSNNTCLESHSEPVTPITDSWAQGSVPILLRPSSASSTSSVQSDQESELSSIAEERPA